MSLKLKLKFLQNLPKEGKAGKNIWNENDSRNIVYNENENWIVNEHEHVKIGNKNTNGIRNGIVDEN